MATPASGEAAGRRAVVAAAPSALVAGPPERREAASPVAVSPGEPLDRGSLAARRARARASRDRRGADGSGRPAAVPSLSAPSASPAGGVDRACVVESSACARRSSKSSRPATDSTSILWFFMSTASRVISVTRLLVTS